MIDEKTNGTKGSPCDLELDGVGRLVGCNYEEDEDNNVDIVGTSAGNYGNKESITPLTHNAVQELGRLGGYADKPFFEPIVQVVHLKKKPSSQFCHHHQKIRNSLAPIPQDCYQKDDCQTSVATGQYYYCAFFLHIMPVSSTSYYSYYMVKQ